MRDRIVTDGFGFGSGGHEESAGFGVRVIHSGVWGFASSPFVTEDEIKKLTAQATDVAKASAISKRFEVKLAPVPAYTDYWSVPVKVKPEDVSLDDKIAFLMQINEAALKMPGVIRVQSSMAFDFEWKYLATSEGSYLEQEIWRTAPNFTVIGQQGRQVQVAHLHGGAADGRLRSGHRRPDARERRADLPPRRSSTARRRRWAWG